MKTPARYTDAKRLHWFALPADARRGDLSDGTAQWAQRSFDKDLGRYVDVWVSL